MHIIFATVLIFIALFLFGFLGNAQNSSDTIRIVEDEIDIDYFQNNKRLSFKQLMNLTQRYKEAYQLITKANNLHITGVCFDVVGGFLVGYAAGYAIGKTIVRNIVDMKTFLPLLGTGIVLVGIGVGFEVGANSKAKKGIAVYNQSLKQKNTTHLEVGFYPNVMVVKINF